jgi:hypothetical protein
LPSKFVCRVLFGNLLSIFSLPSGLPFNTQTVYLLNSELQTLGKKAYYQGYFCSFLKNYRWAPVLSIIRNTGQSTKINFKMNPKNRII